jgi:hypothetical protein
MNGKSNFPLSFDPDAWEFSVVAHRPRRWLPTSRRPGSSLLAKTVSGRLLFAPRGARCQAENRLMKVLDQAWQLSSALARADSFAPSSRHGSLAVRMKANS